MKINLLSDTVTKPTPDMLKAMMHARVGDDIYKDDLSTIALEEKVATMFGMEAALYFPSGTMTNQAAIKLHTQPGDQLICDKDSHIYHYEGGGVSFNSGVSCRLIDGVRGTVTAEQVAAVINDPANFHNPLTTLVSLENTANKGGGTCYDFNEILKIKEVCTNHGLKLHLDGARLWNALVKKGETPKQYGEVFDSISVCLSKGLGCPVGSVLLGTSEYIKRAYRVRKVLGGAMRQIGYLTEAGIYALDNHIERLANDHARAAELAALLQQQPYIKEVTPVETNIVIFELEQGMDNTGFVKELASKNILISPMGTKLRIVTHLDYTQEMHEYVLKTLENIKVSQAT